MKKYFFLFGAAVFCMFIGTLARAEAPFYEGKTIRFIVGLSAGGGYDLYTRAIARHMGKYIPGNPTIIVENMTGAGSLISANYVYKVAKPDGLTIGHPSGNIFLNQIFKQPGIEFDARKFEYIGAPYQDDMVVFISRASGITSMEKWFSAKNPVKFGGEAPGATFSDNIPRILKAALGLPVKSVSGYKGGPEVRLAVESGELDGICTAWEPAKATWGRRLESGEVIPVLQVVPKAISELPQVPLAINYAQTAEAKQLIELGVHIPPVFARPYMMPPGTPKEKVQILRSAFQETLKDKDLLAELKKAKLALIPATGEELEKAINLYFKQDPVLLAKLKDILYK